MTVAKTRIASETMVFRVEEDTMFANNTEKLLVSFLKKNGYISNLTNMSNLKGIFSYS